MQANYTLKFNHMLKKSIICCAMIGIVALAAASSGGGGTKKKSILKPELTPIRTSTGYSMRPGIRYTGSQILSSQKTRSGVTFNTLATYQKGNTVFILPNQYRVNTAKSGFKSNFKMIDFKIKLNK
jgi:hypothetical protein